MKPIKTIAAILICMSVFIIAASADDLADLRANLSKQSSTFKDMKATLTMAQSNRRELEKMGKVFAESYQFKKADILFKAPGKLKMNGELGMLKAEFITTDTKRLVRVPTMRFKKSEDISKSPEIQMTPLDVGVVTDAIWNLYKVKLVRMEKNDNGGPVYVLGLSTPSSKKSQMIWVDGGDFKLLRRDRILDDGSLKVRTVFSEHKQTNGLWIPARAEVFNGDGKLAAVTETKNIQINIGVDDKEFE